MATLAPIPARASANVAAEQALKRAILDGRIAAGEKLPPERELAVTLGVSRLTLRAALATLTAAGLIAVRHGSGYVVRDFRRTGGSDLLDGIVELAGESGNLVETAAELLRVRRHLAGAVLEALAERPPRAPARRAVLAAIDRFAAACATGVGELAAADLGIVRALLDATGSEVLRVCLNPIIAVVNGSAALRDALYAEPATNLAGWRALAAWIERPVAAAVPILVAALAAHDASTLARLARLHKAQRRRAS